MASARFSFVETLRFAVCAALEHFLFFLGVGCAQMFSILASVGVLCGIVLYPMRHTIAALFSQTDTLPQAEKVELLKASTSFLSKKLGVAGLLIALFAFAVYSFFALGTTRIMLDIHDRGTTSFGQLFSGLPLLLKGMTVSALYFGMVVLGLLFFVVPGIIAAIAFSLSLYIVVDKQCGALEALRESARLTKGSRWHLFGLFVLMALINRAVPMLYIVFWPVSLLALAYVYRHLQMTTASA